MSRFMNIRTPKIKNYFTLSEVLQLIVAGQYNPALTSGQWVPTLLGNASDILPIALSNETTESFWTIYPAYDWKNKDIVKVLFTQYVYPKYWRYYFVVVESDILHPFDQNQLDESTIEVVKRVDDVIVILNETYPKYSVLIEKYEAEKTHLLDSIEQSRELLHKYNDTPQSSGLEDPFTSDTHLTDASKDIEKLQNDLTTKMQRLDEINRLWQNIYVKWANEFKCLFIPGGEYDYEG